MTFLVTKALQSRELTERRKAMETDNEFLNSLSGLRRELTERRKAMETLPKLFKLW